MLHWLNAPKPKVKRYSNGVSEVELDPLILKISEIALRSGISSMDNDLIIEALASNNLSMPETDDDKFLYVYHIMRVLHEELNFSPTELAFFNEIAYEILLPIDKASRLFTVVYEGFITKSTLEQSKEAFFKILSK